MKNIDLSTNLNPLYEAYKNVIKPLIAEIEVRYEQFPIVIFNEIRAFNDHIARCYIRPDDNDWTNSQIRKAQSHIERMILDCYKFLNVSLYDNVIKDFDKRYKGVDLSYINDGDFIIMHRRLSKEIILKLKEAKLKEHNEDKSESIALYQEVHNKYTELENLIDSNARNLYWAKGKHKINRFNNIILWFVSAILSGIVSPYLIQYIIECIKL